MQIGGTTHIFMIIASIIFLVVLMFIVSKLHKRGQNIVFFAIVLICMAGIFYLHGTHYGTSLDIVNLLKQQLQVCNFNFILLPLCLIPKNELARQYLFYFSLFCALSTFVAYPSSIENSYWYQKECLNFWIDHLLIVALPLTFIASKRFKPQKEYIFKVMLCIFIYYSIAFLGNLILDGFDFSNLVHNYSYTMNAGAVMILQPLYDLISIPFVYLLPLVPFMYMFFWLLAYLFRNYKVKKY